MPNIRLTLAYDGARYVGWQIQPNGVSVQSVLMDAVLKLTGETPNIIAAGRTDSGVHALGQVVNFQTESTIPATQFRPGLQNFLPEDVVVREAVDVDAGFHATYDAVWKRYRYVIHTSGVRDPFLNNKVWRLHGTLDVDAMQSAALELLGTHDFRCFESHFPNKATSVRTIREARFRRSTGWPIWTDSALPDDAEPPTSHEGVGEFICFDIAADGFLYNMVRAIVGTLIKVGRGKWTREDVHRIIENKDRSQAGETGPACGLYLVHVEYS